jgi:hypothetical protein
MRNCASILIETSRYWQDRIIRIVETTDSVIKSKEITAIPCKTYRVGRLNQTLSLSGSIPLERRTRRDCLS